MYYLKKLNFINKNIFFLLFIKKFFSNQIQLTNVYSNNNKAKKNNNNFENKLLKRYSSADCDFSLQQNIDFDVPFYKVKLKNPSYSDKVATTFSNASIVQSRSLIAIEKPDYLNVRRQSSASVAVPI